MVLMYPSKTLTTLRTQRSQAQKQRKCFVRAYRRCQRFIDTKSKPTACRKVVCSDTPPPITVTPHCRSLLHLVHRLPQNTSLCTIYNKRRSSTRTCACPRVLIVVRRATIIMSAKGLTSKYPVLAGGQSVQNTPYRAITRYGSRDRHQTGLKYTN